MSERRLLLDGFLTDQDQKDFNNEIKNIRCERILYEGPQELGDSIMKPAKSNGPSSDTTYLDTVLRVFPWNSNAFKSLLISE
jgi:hypothetical protein